MLDKIAGNLDKLCPVKKIRIKEKGSAWITNEIICAIHEKDRARKKAKKSKLPTDWIIAKKQKK